MKLFTFLASQERKLIYALIAMVAALLVGHVLAVLLAKYSWQIERAFHLDYENNIPTWYSSFLWVLAGIKAFRCSQRAQNKRESNLWFILTFVFLFLSCDEVASLHENFSKLIRNHLMKDSFQGQFVGGELWPLFFGPFIVVLAIWLVVELKVLLHHSKEAITCFLIGLGLFVGGALVLEILSHFVLNMFSVPGDLLSQIEVMTEEGCEMLGVILILSSLFAFERSLTHGPTQELAGMNVSAKIMF